MTRQFQRYCRVNVGGVKLQGGNIVDSDGTVTQGFRVRFKVRKTVKIEFNSKELEVFNLAEETRNNLTKANDDGPVPVLLEAGYAGGYSTIFSGHIRTLDHVREGRTWITKMQSSDGLSSASARLYQSFGPGTSVTEIASKLAEASGLKKGNLLEQVSSAVRQGLKQFAHGFSTQGPAMREMDTLLRSLGLSWSVQDGEIEVTKGLGGIDDGGGIPLVSENTGLIGSPAHIKWVPNWPTYTKARTLLDPRIRCNREVRVESRNVKRSFRMMVVVHEGDTHDGDWITEFEGV